jgi:hypothetical protein
MLLLLACAWLDRAPLAGDAWSFTATSVDHGAGSTLVVSDSACLPRRAADIADLWTHGFHLWGTSTEVVVRRGDSVVYVHRDRDACERTRRMIMQEGVSARISLFGDLQRAAAR